MRLTPTWIVCVPSVTSAPVVLASAANVPVNATFVALGSDGVPSTWNANVPLGRISTATGPEPPTWTPTSPAG